MTLSSYGDLAIAFIILYTIVLPLAVLVCLRHGFGKQLGWFYLIIVPVVRIAGAACQLAADSKPSVGIITATTILNSLGFIPLVLVLLGILERIHQGMRNPHPLGNRIFRLAHIIALVCLILAIVAGIDSSHPNNASDLSTALKLRKATAILLLIITLVLALTSLFFLSRISHVLDRDRLLVYAAIASLPFLLVREVDSLLVAFSSSTLFHGLHQNVFVLAFMVYLMEYTAAVIFVAAGLRTASGKVESGRTAAGPAGFEMKDSERQGRQEHRVGGSYV